MPEDKANPEINNLLEKLLKNEEDFIEILRLINSIPRKYSIKEDKLKLKFTETPNSKLNCFLYILFTLNIISIYNSDIYRTYNLKVNRNEARKYFMNAFKDSIPFSNKNNELFDQINVITNNEIREDLNNGNRYLRSYLKSYSHPKKYITENLTLALLYPFLKQRFQNIFPFDTKFNNDFIECVFGKSAITSLWDYGIDITANRDYKSIEKKYKYLKYLRKKLFIIVFCPISDKHLKKLERKKPINVEIIQWYQIDEVFNREFPAKANQQDLQIPNNVKKL